MPAPYLARGNPFVFPGGNPGYDPSHVAASHLIRYSGVAAPGGTFVNLLTGKQGTPVGALQTYGIDGRAGPYCLNTTDSSAVKVPNSYSDSPTWVTMAGIAVTTGGGTQGVWFANADTSSGSHQSTLYSNLSVAYSNGATGVVSGITLNSNTPYLIIASVRSGEQIFTAVSLLNGKIQQATKTSVFTVGSGNANWVVGGRYDQTGYYSNVRLAAVMYSLGRLTAQQQLEWATAPWSFWFPQRLRRLIYASLGNPAAGSSVSLFGSITAKSNIKSALTLPLALAGKTVATSRSTGAMTGAAPLSGRAASKSSAAAALTAGLSLAGKVSAGSRATSALTANLALSGRATAATRLTGAAAGSVALSGRAASASRMGGNATGSAPLVGRATAASKLTGAATGSAAISGRIGSASKAKGAITGSAALIGRVTATSRATGALVGTVPLFGSARTASAMRIAEVGVLLLYGRLMASGRLSGGLVGSVPLAGRAFSAAIAKDGLTGSVRLSGRAGAASHLQAQPTLPAALAGRVGSGAFARSALVGSAALSGRVTTAATGGLSTLNFLRLLGRISAGARMGGVLSTLLPPPPPPPPPTPQPGGGGGPAFPLHGTYEEFFRDLENLDRLPSDIIRTVLIEAADLVLAADARLVYGASGLIIPSEADVLWPDARMRFSVEAGGIAPRAKVSKAEIRDDIQDVMEALEAMFPMIRSRLRGPK